MEIRDLYQSYLEWQPINKNEKVSVKKICHFIGVCYFNYPRNLQVFYFGFVGIASPLKKLQV